MPNVSGSQVIYNQRHPSLWGNVLINAAQPVAQGLGGMLVDAIRGPSPTDQYNEAMAQKLQADNEAALGDRFQALLQGNADPAAAKQWAMQWAKDHNLSESWQDPNNPMYTMTPGTQLTREAGNTALKIGLGDQPNQGAPATPAPSNYKPLGAEAAPTPSSSPDSTTAPPGTEAERTVSAAPPNSDIAKMPPMDATSSVVNAEPVPATGLTADAQNAAATQAQAQGDAPPPQPVPPETRASIVAHMQHVQAALNYIGQGALSLAGKLPDFKLNPDLMAAAQMTDEYARRAYEEYQISQGILPEGVSLLMPAIAVNTLQLANTPQGQAIIARGGPQAQAMVDQARQEWDKLARTGSKGLQEAVMKLAGSFPQQSLPMLLPYFWQTKNEEVVAGQTNRQLDQAGALNQARIAEMNAQIARLGVDTTNAAMMGPLQVQHMQAQTRAIESAMGMDRLKLMSDIEQTRFRGVVQVTTALAKQKSDALERVKLEENERRDSLNAMASMLGKLQQAQTAFNTQDVLGMTWANKSAKELADAQKSQDPGYMRYKQQSDFFRNSIDQVMTGMQNLLGTTPSSLLAQGVDPATSGAVAMQRVDAALNQSVSVEQELAQKSLMLPPDAMVANVRSSPDSFRVLLGAKYMNGTLQGYDLTGPQLAAIAAGVRSWKDSGHLPSRQDVMKDPQWKKLLGDKANLGYDVAIKLKGFMH